MYVSVIAVSPIKSKMVISKDMNEISTAYYSMKIFVMVVELALIVDLFVGQ